MDDVLGERVMAGVRGVFRGVGDVRDERSSKGVDDDSCSKKV
jgi:hypothetical protein